MRVRPESGSSSLNYGAGIIKDFLLFPKSKGEPLSGYKRMKDMVRFVT